MMKKILMIAAVALALASCSKTENQQDADEKAKTSEFRTETIDKKCLLTLPDSVNFYGKGSKVFTRVQASICWPVTIGGKEPRELQDSILSIAFAEQKDSTLTASLSRLASTPVGFEDEKEGVKMTDVKTVPAASETVHVHTTEVTATPTMINDRLLTYRIDSYSFLGGAHGYGMSQYVNYDIKGEKVLTVGRVFADVQGLKTAIMRSLQMNQDNAGMLLVDSVPSVGNFYVDGALITFVYNPYEVACYAAGQVTVQLPLYEVRDYMSDYGKKLFPVEE